MPNDVHQMHRICLSRQQYLAQSLGEFASKLNHLLSSTIVLLVYDLSLRNMEKDLSHSQEVEGNVASIRRATLMFSNPGNDTNLSVLAIVSGQQPTYESKYFTQSSSSPSKSYRIWKITIKIDKT